MTAFGADFQTFAPSPRDTGPTGERVAPGRWPQN
jgi:hypothetical protein